MNGFVFAWACIHGTVRACGAGAQTLGARTLLPERAADCCLFFSFWFSLAFGRAADCDASCSSVYLTHAWFICLQRYYF